MPQRRNDPAQTDNDGNPIGPRRSVSPPTQSAFGPASASDPPPAKAAAPAPAGKNPTQDLSAAGAINAIKQHKADTDKAIDDQSG